MGKIQDMATDLYINRMRARICRFNASHPTILNEYDIKEQVNNIDFENSKWEVKLEVKKLEDKASTYTLDVNFFLISGYTPNTNTGIVFEFDNWEKENFVLMPSAVYNGNRFTAKEITYPPMYKDKDDMKERIPVIISDVPRLNINEGISRIQLLTGDMATPAIGFYSIAMNRGFWLITNQGNDYGDSMIEIEESSDRKKASITVSSPGVRYDKRYTICSTNKQCQDKGHDFKQDDKLQIKLKLFSFPCSDVQGLYDHFIKIRKELADEVELVNKFPLYNAWLTIEDKYNLQNWEERFGYYSVGMRDSIYSDWQVGWVGGIMNTYPMLSEGCEKSRRRALSTFDFLFDYGQDASGFFHGCFHKGIKYGDNFDDPSANWHLIRKSSDALYFLLKQFMLLQKTQDNWVLPKKWEAGTRKCADAFVTLWSKYGQFGQFVDSKTGDIVVGGTACASTAPAGLALAWKFFGKEEYLEVAKTSAKYYYDNYVKRGYTNGGPGEILQCPDSESAFGLLESFIVLYETSGDNIWLEAAKKQGNQCSTWCVSYDFKFPKASTFGVLGIHTSGSVYANVQNKHSAPGICTLSGDSLFKLFRYTGETVYLELLKELAHNITQYLSREDVPIKGLEGFWPDFDLEKSRFTDMPKGWMNERVNMSDWLEPVGEIFYGSCWSEVSCMLTYVEVPGLYIQTDTGFICAIDHIQAFVVENNKEFIKVSIKNPTEYIAKVKVFCEMSSQMSEVFGQNALYGCNVICLKPGESRNIEFKIMV